MSVVAKSRAVRFIHFGISSLRLSERSNRRYSKKETEALFRALGNNNNDGGSGDSPDNPSAPIDSPSRREEKFTLDDFFSNLDESNRKRSSRDRKPRRSSRERIAGGVRNNKRSVEDNHRTTAYAEKNNDLSSFFEEVNSIMKQNKMNQESSVGIDKSGERNSIFEISPPTKQRNPNAYEEDSFDQYTEMLERIITNKKFLRRHTRNPLDGKRAESVLEWLKSDGPTIPCNLPSLEKAMKEGLSEQEESRISVQFREELDRQKESFVSFYGWDEQQYTVAVRALTNLGGLCAKKASGAPLDIAWQKLKEAGFKMDKETLHNYLYVSSTFSNRMIQIPTSGGSLLDFLKKDGDFDGQDVEKMNHKEGGQADDAIDVASEVALCHDFLYDPSEQSTSIRVRMLVSQGRAKDAERLLDMNTGKEDLRLRTYAPVYKAYLDEGDVSSAFSLFVKMKQGENVLLQPETYVQLMACIAENGYFRNGSHPIDGPKELGYPEASGPILFDSLASELANNSIEISGASAKRLYNAFQRGFGENSNIQELHLLESIPTCNDQAPEQEIVVSRVTLDETNGRCPRTGTKLRLIGLNNAQKTQLKDGLIHLSLTSYEERAQKKNSTAEVELRRFGEWLETRSGPPFTAIIDGPNVAYYMQNFEQGIFNYHQIQFVVEALERMGENVLVILPKKYTFDNFLITAASGNKRQRLTEKEKRICQNLISSGKAYCVPSGCLDDYYWMYASVSGQETYVNPENDEGRWPGVRPMLISNDKMRDHKLSLLEPRLFRRWYSNFIVNFTFSAFVGEECDDKEIGFKTADFYSREIQGNVTLDDTGKNRGTVWHFPVSDWDDNESFCIRIPSK